jgi:hypothetical protein
MARRRNLSSPFISKEDLGYEENEEVIGLCDANNYDPNETVISSFDFSNSSLDDKVHENINTLASESSSKKTSINNILEDSNVSLKNISSMEKLQDNYSTDNRTNKSTPNGITPPIDGEFFTVKRTYTLRKSTIKMLNHIKALDEDINVYMNTLVDAAIRHYYEHVKEGQGDGASVPHS